MRFKREVTSLLVSILFASLILSFIPQTPLQGVEQTDTERAMVDTVVAGVPHGVIVIDGNDQFDALAEVEGWGGDGSEDTPYILEGFDFDLGGTNGKCIEIADTTVHFIIRSCSFTGATGSGGAGIYLSNATNSEISGNILYDNYYGILVSTDNTTVMDNDITVSSAFGAGIYCGGMRNSLISGNTIKGGYVGLDMESAEYCEVSNNTISDSFELSMYLASSDYVTVADNEFINGSTWGLYIYYSENCTIIRNTCSICGDGISLAHSRDNIIKDCILEGNTNGLSFESVTTTTGNVIEFCEFRDNTALGVIIEGNAFSNLFKWNVFMNNGAPVLSDGLVNIFDYNYYEGYVGSDVDGDKIGDFPYPLLGSEDGEDPHPLLLLPTYPEWDPSPVNQNVEFGDDFTYDLEVESLIPIGEWQISDTTHFVADETGTIRNIAVLDIGDYLIDIAAINTYGLSVEGSFTITVEDSTTPIWVSQIQDRTFTFGEDVEIQLMAWDLAGIESWDISDSENFSTTSTSFAETSILTIFSIGDLAVGTYSLTITAYDSSGNYATATLTITVTASGTGGTDAIGVEFIISTAGLAVAIIALIVGFVAFLNARKKS